MDVKTEVMSEVTERFAVYRGDCVEVMRRLPDASVDFSVYSPPFAGLYNYSSDPRDVSNAASYEDFLVHYGFVVDEKTRLTKPGRCTAVHCADVPIRGVGGSGEGLRDLSGDIIRLHESKGWVFVARYCVWKEPLGVRLRTMAKGLAHRTIVDDSSKCTNAAADYLLVFRRYGENAEPIAHPTGLDRYAGASEMPSELAAYRNWTGDQKENRFSHWIWRRYASAFWDDVRLERVLPYKESKAEDDEKHVHPLQLDVIERAVVLWSNPGETVLTPFMGVGSEVYGSVINGRRGVGVELKASYFRQARLNMLAVDQESEQMEMTP